jgi:hypothetical protein
MGLVLFNLWTSYSYWYSISSGADFTFIPQWKKWEKAHFL